MVPTRSTPTRRRYLRGIGGFGSASLLALAGCLGGAPTDDEPPDSDGGSDGGSTDTRPSGTGGPGITIAAVDGEIDLPIEPAVEIVREAATATHPPRLRTVLTNAGDERVRVGEGRAVHFEYGRDTSGALVLLPAEGEFPAEPDCWRLIDDVAVTEEYRTFEIDAGESSSRAVDLYATPGEAACLPVGEYRFETAISIVSEDVEPQSSAQWGFSILLE